ncbi:MAG: hypothetical protein J7L14_02570 [Candidatus Diapherotrites archaeon]|nr:hypothetical protein [Candidatus Diapherotrites archaeon]
MANLYGAELVNQTTNVTGTLTSDMNIFEWIISLGFGGISGFFLILPICYSLVGDDSYKSKFFWGFYVIFAFVFSAVFNYYGKRATPVDCLMFLFIGITIAIFIYLIKKEIH